MQLVPADFAGRQNLDVAVMAAAVEVRLAVAVGVEFVAGVVVLVLVLTSCARAVALVLCVAFRAVAFLQSAVPVRAVHSLAEEPLCVH